MASCVTPTPAGTNGRTAPFRAACRLYASRKGISERTAENHFYGICGPLRDVLEMIDCANQAGAVDHPGRIVETCLTAATVELPSFEDAYDRYNHADAKEDLVQAHFDHALRTGKVDDGLRRQYAATVGAETWRGMMFRAVLTGGLQ